MAKVELKVNCTVGQMTEGEHAGQYLVMASLVRHDGSSLKLEDYGPYPEKEKALADAKDIAIYLRQKLEKDMNSFLAELQEKKAELEQK